MGSLAHHQLALHWGELGGDRWAVTKPNIWKILQGRRGSIGGGFLSGECNADVRRALEPGTHLPGDRWLWQDLAQSECGGGAAGVLADEGGEGGESQERGSRHLRVSAGCCSTLHLLRHTAWWVPLWQLWDVPDESGSTKECGEDRSNELRLQRATQSEDHTGVH